MVNTQDLQKAETFFKTVLEYYNPDFGLAETDPLYDLLVRTARLYKIPELLVSMEQAKTNRSLLQTAATTADYDQLLANFFITRNIGTLKSATARLYFPTNLVAGKVSAGTIVAAGSGLFTVVADFVVSPASYALETQDPYKGKYYIDVVTRAIAPGELLDVVDGVSGTISTFRATDAVVLVNVEGGSSTETNEEAYVRGKKLITIRNWVSDLSINGQLAELYPNLVKNSLVVGFLEPEMVRDRVLVDLPKQSVRLFFASKAAFTASSAATRFIYPSGARYTPLVTTVVNPTSTIWKQDIAGTWYFDIEVAIASSSNSAGFELDKQVQVETNNGNGWVVYANTAFRDARSTVTSRYDETGGGTVIHIGSHTDIYIRPETQRKTVQLAIPANSSGFVALPDSIKPLLRIEEILDELGDPVGVYSLPTPSPYLRFSGKDDTSLFVNPGLVGTTVTLTATCAPLVNTIQKHIDNSLQRVVDSNTLVRYFNPIFVNGLVQLSLNSAGSASPEDTLQTALSDFFSGRGTGGSVTSDQIIGVLREALPTIREIVSIDLEGVQYYPDGSIILSTTPDSVDVEEDTVWGITQRNTVFEKGTWEFIFIT